MLVVGGTGSSAIYQLDPARQRWFRRKEELRQPRGATVAMAVPRNLFELMPRKSKIEIDCSYVSINRFHHSP